MAYPDLKVYMAFSDGPYVQNPTWTSITEWVLNCKINRGRGDDFDSSFVSTASLTLNNNTRLFDPFNTSSTYNNQLTPRRPIKITGTANGTEYIIFRGFVSGFPVSWGSAGKISTVSIQAYDIVSLLNSANLRNDFADIYTRSLSPVHYYKCSDANGSTTIKDFGSAVKDLSLSGSTIPLVSSFPLGMGLSGDSADLIDSPYLYSAAATPTTGNITISFWARWNSTDNTEQVFYMGSAGDSIAIEGNYQYATGQYGVFVETNRGGSIHQAWSQTGRTPTNTIAKHYAVTYTKSSGVVQVYINGVAQTMASTGVNTSINLFPATSITLLNIAFQEVALFDKILTPTEIETIYQFGAGSSDESTTARINRLIALTDLSPWTTMKSIHTSPVATISGIPEPNAIVSETLQQVMETEGGYMFATREGVLKTVNRNYLSTNSTSITPQIVIADDGTGTEYSGEIEIWYDGDNFRNEVTVKQASGLQVYASDETSVANFGRHSYSIESQSGSETEASDLANHWLTFYKQIVPSVSAIEIGKKTSTGAAWATLLQLEVLDRVTFKRTPSIGSAFVTDLILNSIEFDLQPKKWSMKVTGSKRFSLLPPTATSLSVSFNQSSATFGANVNANGNSTTVEFQYSTSSTFSSGVTTVSGSPSPLTGSTSTAVSASVSGLSNGTLYYYRVKATNSVATTFLSGSFTTYTLKTVRFSSSGTWTKPTAPTGGAALSSGIDAFVIGGGGSNSNFAYGGAGGGAAVSNSSLSLASSMVAVIGAADGTSSLTNLGTAAKGNFTDDFFNPDGASSGSGFGGGTGYLDIFATNPSNGGGGGGNSSAGVSVPSSTGYGGDGGTGSTVYTFTYGSGGAGFGDYGSGANGGGSASTYGRGGDGGGVGFSATGGYGGFKYYGPTGSRSGTGWTEV
jgi:hypothetical protein